jgi:hypothetical protein
MSPNLFKYATSELSQDALLCWLFEWANPELGKSNPVLNKISTDFIISLCDCNINSIENLEIRRQYKNIDILLVINKTKAILIEDKVHSGVNGNQLPTYLKLLSKEFNPDNIYPIYLKTGEQSNYENIKNHGYKPFLRKEILSVFKKGINDGVTNNIFLDFYNHLKNMDDSIESYQNLTVGNWTHDSWKGFFSELQNELGTGEWKYVPQKNGGFIGFWWSFNLKNYNGVDFEYYLQLEFNKFCFKVSPYDITQNCEIRDYYRSKLFQTAKNENFNLLRNGRCRPGKTSTMTVAKLPYDYRVKLENGLIDMEKTIENLKRAEQLISKI